MEIGKKRKLLQSIHILETLCDEIFARWVSEQRLEGVHPSPGTEPRPQDSLEEPTVASTCRPAVNRSVAVAGAVVRALILCSGIVLYVRMKHDVLNTAIAASPLQSHVICFTRSVEPQAPFGPLSTRIGG